MKKGLVLEGGAMRGMFTAGVLDVMMREKLVFDGLIGVSAGAVFGCNYKSLQPGRTIRYNKKYCRDPRYAGIRSLLKTGDIYGEKFCYHDIPDSLDPFDAETFRNNPMEFYVVCTDVNTGNPVYHKCETGEGNDLEWMRASASMPLVSRIVSVDGYMLSDGGTADSIPLRYFQSIGYEKNVLVLTQPADFVKKPNNFLPLIKLKMGRYPDFIKAVKDRHIRYNETLEYISSEEKKGNIFVIRPAKKLAVHSVEHSSDHDDEIDRLGNHFANGRRVVARRGSEQHGL